MERNCPGWFSCNQCCSDSSSGEVVPYDETYLEVYRHHIDFEKNIRELRSNLDWFDDFKNSCPDRHYLDIGCADGASLVGMARRGWHPHGFDINPAVRSIYPITISPQFNAAHVPQFSAILCREVIEHVPDWHDMLVQISRATKPGGLVQIQTPLPGTDHPNIYQKDHLQIFSPGILESRLVDLGFVIIESRTWTEVQPGQKFIARKK